MKELQNQIVESAMYSMMKSPKKGLSNIVIGDIVTVFEERLSDAFYSVIVQNDWSKYPVVRVIYLDSGPNSEEWHEGSFTLDMGEVKVLKYEDKAPPIDSYDFEESAEIWTLTRPLLDSLGIDYENNPQEEDK